jgi:hypothetical protein
VRIWKVACACALLFGGCLLPKYSVDEDGGPAGAAGMSGAAGASGVAGRGGTGGAATGTAGAAGTGTPGTGGGGRGGSAGSVGATGGTGGVVTITGTAGFTGTAGAGGSAGRGGTTGTAGTSGGAAGRGGTTGTGGGAAGRGGTTGAAGSAGRGGTTGSAGSSAGRGGSSTGTGGSSAGGSTVAPSWLNDISVVYQFDTDTPVGEIGVEAHGIGSLHLESQGTNIPQLSSTAIEGGSVSLIGTLQYPSYMQTTPGIGLPSVFQTGPTNSWTTGGWFHITSTANQQWLVHDEGPTNFQQGGFFFYVDQQMGRLSSGTAFAYCRAGVSYNAAVPENSNMKEVETPESNLIGNLGFDQNVSGNWVHLVCRYNAGTNELSILVGGVQRAGNVDTTHQLASGPGPFMIGCSEAGYCALQGNADEVFFETSALTDSDVLRIYACGIDGSRCRCNSTGGYASCGLLGPANCGLLPACNGATP